MADTNSKPTPMDLAANELQDFGRLLDALESGRVPINARQYRKASVLAIRTLKLHFDAPCILDACATSSALRELRDNVKFERDVAAGAQLNVIPGMTERDV